MWSALIDGCGPSLILIFKTSSVRGCGMGGGIDASEGLPGAFPTPPAATSPVNELRIVTQPQ